MTTWIEEKRNEGLRHFEALPVPPAPTRERKFPTLALESLLKENPDPDSPTFQTADKRVIVSLLSEALKNYEQKIHSYLTEVARAEKNKWVALNQARWQDGAFVYIPKGIEASSPIFLHHNAGMFPRVLILAEPGSRAILFDDYQSSQQLVAPVIEIVAMDDAAVTYIQAQHCGKETHFYNTVKAIGSRHSNIKTFSCFNGSRRTVNQVQVSLKGEGAEAKLLGLTLGKEEQVFEHYTLQEHIARHTESDLLMKVVLRDQAYSHFDGLIWIEKGAKKTNAYQQNRNLLLSKDAKAETTPRLEILDDDVRCTHGATVGPVDEDQLFYFESRGIPRAEAEKLLVEGFSRQVLDQIPDSSVRNKVEEIFGFEGNNDG